MSELLLIVILHTSRAASHGHDIITVRHKSVAECQIQGRAYKKIDSRNSYTCIPVAPLKGNLP